MSRKENIKYSYQEYKNEQDKVGSPFFPHRPIVRAQLSFMSVFLRSIIFGQCPYNAVQLRFKTVGTDFRPITDNCFMIFNNFFIQHNMYNIYLNKTNSWNSHVYRSVNYFTRIMYY